MDLRPRLSGIGRRHCRGPPGVADGRLSRPRPSRHLRDAVEGQAHPPCGVPDGGRRVRLEHGQDDLFADDEERVHEPEGLPLGRHRAGGFTRRGRGRREGLVGHAGPVPLDDERRRGASARDGAGRHAADRTGARAGIEGGGCPFVSPAACGGSSLRQLHGPLQHTAIARSPCARPAPLGNARPASGTRGPAPSPPPSATGTLRRRSRGWSSPGRRARRRVARSRSATLARPDAVRHGPARGGHGLPSRATRETRKMAPASARAAAASRFSRRRRCAVPRTSSVRARSNGIGRSACSAIARAADVSAASASPLAMASSARQRAASGIADTRWSRSASASYGPSTASASATRPRLVSASTRSGTKVRTPGSSTPATSMNGTIGASACTRVLRPVARQAHEPQHRRILLDGRTVATLHRRRESGARSRGCLREAPMERIDTGDGRLQERPHQATRLLHVRPAGLRDGLCHVPASGREFDLATHIQHVGDGGLVTRGLCLRVQPLEQRPALVEAPGPRLDERVDHRGPPLDQHLRRDCALEFERSGHQARRVTAALQEFEHGHERERASLRDGVRGRFREGERASPVQPRRPRGRPPSSRQGLAAARTR